LLIAISMRPLLRPILLITLLLLVPILPFVMWGSQLEVVFEQWFQQWSSPQQTALLIVTLLATDILLPIPSSLISTFGGARLGWWGGTLASWFGLTLGAVFGFALARRWGRPLARRLSSEQQLESMESLCDRYGAAVLVVTRALPIMAEASVLFVGIQRLAWRRFLPPVLLSNLGLALAYSVFGDLAAQHEWLPLALAISLALPLLLAAAARRRLADPGSDCESH
jgi:uncharacterized membrane protein YdjX (TVP38/TMEM64 family)